MGSISAYFYFTFYTRFRKCLRNCDCPCDEEAPPFGEVFGAAAELADLVIQSFLEVHVLSSSVGANAHLSERVVWVGGRAQWRFSTWSSGWPFCARPPRGTRATAIQCRVPGPDERALTALSRPSSLTSHLHGFQSVLKPSSPSGRPGPRLK